jgi:hypothetical protein
VLSSPLQRSRAAVGKAEEAAVSWMWTDPEHIASDVKGCGDP